MFLIIFIFLVFDLYVWLSKLQFWRVHAIALALRLISDKNWHLNVRAGGRGANIQTQCIPAFSALVARHRAPMWRGLVRCPRPYLDSGGSSPSNICSCSSCVRPNSENCSITCYQTQTHWFTLNLLIINDT